MQLRAHVYWIVTCPLRQLAACSTPAWKASLWQRQIIWSSSFSSRFPLEFARPSGKGACWMLRKDVVRRLGSRSSRRITAVSALYPRARSYSAIAFLAQKQPAHRGLDARVRHTFWQQIGKVLQSRWFFTLRHTHARARTHAHARYLPLNIIFVIEWYISDPFFSFIFQFPHRRYLNLWHATDICVWTKLNII